MSEVISVNTSFVQNYNCHFGKDLSAEFGRFLQEYSSTFVFLVIDETVFNHHFGMLEDILSKNFSRIHVFKVPSGESSKSHKMFGNLLDFILAKGVERKTPLVAVGGGVTGDLAGFAAATALRGIPLIHIPTTLLAMVDSSIGGKTGINHSTGKNLVGSFYQPDAVFADARFLSTLPKNEWVNGLSEVLKYGMIHSPEILSEVRTLMDENKLTDGEAWLPIIKKSAQIKVDFVSTDVLEHGKRAYLNFGHTFAHVIENVGKFGQYSHGEAVYAGMVGAVYASNNLGAGIDASKLLAFKKLYNISLGQFRSQTDQMIELMKRDKKVVNEKIRLILLKKIGASYTFDVEDVDMLKETWQFIFKTFE